MGQINRSSLIELIKVDLGYQKERPLLHNITLNIPRNSCIYLQGVNGSGKSTLAKLFLGIIQPLSGSIYISYKRPAYVPQHTHFDRQFPLCLYDLVEQGIPPPLLSFFTSKRKVSQRRKIIWETLQQLGLKEYAHLKLDQASGGQLQKALVARSLVANPDFLILDEPFNHLDQASRVLLENLLINKQKQGNLSLCIIDHNLQNIQKENFTHKNKNAKGLVHHLEFTHVIQIEKKINLKSFNSTTL